MGPASYNHSRTPHRIPLHCLCISTKVQSFSFCIKIQCFICIPPLDGSHLVRPPHAFHWVFLHFLCTFIFNQDSIFTLKVLHFIFISSTVHKPFRGLISVVDSQAIIEWSTVHPYRARFDPLICIDLTVRSLPVPVVPARFHCS